MDLSTLFPTKEQLESVRGIESDLLRRKRTGMVGLFAGLAAAVFEIFFIAINSGQLEPLGSVIQSLFRLEFRELWAQIYTPTLIGFAFIVVGFGTYFLIKKTRFLLKEAEEPFRYTFSIEPFKSVRGAEGGEIRIGTDNWFHNLLHHDLMERLNERIKRLFLLEDVSPEETDSDSQQKLLSHIHVSGYYAVREKEKGEKVFYVMPRVRIGPAGNPSTLAHPVKYPLKIKEKVGEESTREEPCPGDGNNAAAGVDAPHPLDTNEYNQIVERIYSSVATEIYSQIQSDLKTKMTLFPTKYMRAVALYHEAEDFARSNTVDAYDRALHLYKEGLRYFDTAYIKWITRFLIKCPVLWRLRIKFKHTEARVHVGYAKCLIYRRTISALSGRYLNPLFEIRGDLIAVLDDLKALHKKVAGFKIYTRLEALMAFLTFPKDSWPRARFFQPLQPHFEKQRHILFDTFTVNALAHYFLGAVTKANAYLKEAKAVAPRMSELNALYLLTAALIEPDLDKEILLFRRAIEAAPDFQMAQYFLAFYSEMRFRAQNEIIWGRAKDVIGEYDRVLDINPGNVGVLVAQGYLYWLVGRLEDAKDKFREGCELKAVVRETFIGELNYGLARVAAEEGDFDKAYDLYNEAVAADPGVGAYSPQAGTRALAPYYDRIDIAMLERFRSFREAVKRRIGYLQEIGEKGLEAEVFLVNLASKFQSDLDGGEITEELRREFSNKNLPIPRVAAVSIEEEPKRWLIAGRENDETATYVVKKDENRLDVYAKKEFSRKTVDVVWSFVLNDYGNACLNYFHRFGSHVQLEEAINSFEQAVQRYGGNAVAYFSLDNAYGWRGDAERDNFPECLEEAEKLAPTWPLVVVNSGLSQVKKARREKLNPVEFNLDLKRKQIQRVTFETAQIENILEDAKRQTSDGSSGQKEFLRGGGKFYDFVGSAKIREEKWRSALAAKERELKRLGRSYDELEREREEAGKELASLIARVLNRIFGETKLSSLFELGDKGDDGNEMLSESVRVKSAIEYLRKIRWDRFWGRLDENDVDTLIALVGILSSDSNDSYNLITAKDFSYRILDNCPENFNTNQHMNGAYRNLIRLAKLDKEELEKKLFEPKKEEREGRPKRNRESAVAGKGVKRRSVEIAREIKGLESKINRYEKSMKRCRDGQKFLAKYWVDQDPFGFSSFYWLLSLVNKEELEGFLKDKPCYEYERAGNHRLRNLLGQGYYYNNKHRVMDTLEQAVTEFKKAIVLKPDEAVYRFNLGKAYEDQKEWGRAIVEYKEAIKLGEEEAVYRFNLGRVYKVRGEWRQAIAELNEACRRDSENAEYRKELASCYHVQGEGYLNQASQREKTVRERAEALERAEASLMRACELEPQNAQYTETLDQTQGRKNIVSQFGEKAFARLPSVAPIAVQVAGNLEPYIGGAGDTGELSPELAQYVGDMRERIKDEFGVTIPGVRFWGNEVDLPPGYFTIMINEVPRGSGNVALDKRLFAGARDGLTRLGVSGEETTNPLTGDEAYWITEKDWDKVEGAGLELWDIVEYPVRHLESVVRRNLTEFLGHQEVLNMCDLGPGYVFELVQNKPEDLSALTAVLKGLLNEGVPIAAFAEIAEEFARLRAQGENLTAVVGEIRSLPDVRPKLSGNDGRYSFYRLGPRFEAEIERAIYGEGSQRVLRMEVEPCQKVLTATRDIVGSGSRVALLVENAELRPFVRSLTEFEFPDVPVLSRAELLPDFEGKVVGEIELDARPGSLLQGPVEVSLEDGRSGRAA
jgi:tetratricopeptide (TPR) repeat protein